MKRILFGIFAMIMTLPCYAVDDQNTGDKRTTSQPYVYNQIETTQVKIPAANLSNTNIGSTVVTYTNVEGGGVIGERGVYTGSDAYNASDDADKLITASALNNTFTTLPTTDTTKLECANQSAGCTLWTIVDQTAYGETITLPAGYTRLAYIESTGTQYLILPYLVNNKTKLYYKYLQTNATSAPGVASVPVGVTDTPDVAKANNGVLRLLNGTSTFNRIGWGDSTSDSVINISGYSNLNTWYEVYYDQNKMYINDNLVATSATNPSTTWTAHYGLGVFARNGSSVTMKSLVRISSLWAKEDGEIKVNLIPAKDSSNVVGMYDLVSNTFFRNAGTGDFIAGPAVN